MARILMDVRTRIWTLPLDRFWKGYFIVPFAYQDRRNKAARARSFISAIRLSATKRKDVKGREEQKNLTQRRKGAKVQTCRLSEKSKHRT
jgi:hypothetical protein